MPTREQRQKKLPDSIIKTGRKKETEKIGPAYSVSQFVILHINQNKT
jgi:hypothetical protein